MNSPTLPGTSHGLLVDDDELYLRTLQRSLARKGLETVTASDIASALVLARQQPPAYALIDLKLGAESGLALIQPLRALREDMRILLVTGYASIATAVEAIKLGADDYLPKPATVPMILRALGEEDDGPADGARAIFNVNIFNPCWWWEGADVDGITKLRVRAGQIPYYFQLAHDEPQRRFVPARSAHGEMDILNAQCDGKALASVPLPATPGKDGFITLEAALPRSLKGRQDLCVRFTGDTRPTMWVLDTLELVPR